MALILGVRALIQGSHRCELKRKTLNKPVGWARRRETAKGELEIRALTPKIWSAGQ